MKKVDRSVISKLLKYAGKYKVLLFISLVLTALSVICTLYIPILAGNAIDNITGKGNVDFDSVKSNIIKLITLALVSAVSQWIAGNINNIVSYRTVRDLRNDATAKICILPFSALDTYRTGDLVSRIISDADQIADGLIMGFTSLFSGILTIMGTLFFMIKISWKIAPVVIILTPLSVFVSKFIAKNTKSMFTAQSKARGAQTALIEETVTAAKIITAYNAEDKVIAEFDKTNDEFAKYSLRAIFFSSITNPSTRFVNNMIYAAVAMTGALYALGGSITIGGLSCFLSYAGQYAKPFNEISGVIAEFQNAVACAGRLFEIIDAEPRTPDNKNAEVLENAEGNIEIIDVDFSYTPEKELIKGFNLNVRKGTRIAIVGPTGCGKTTLINLLMRFYDTDSGSIFIDGTDIKEITRHSLRNNYGMVLQDTWLKTGTVRENIALGRPDATDEEIINAAKSAYAHSFIKRLPNGYDTVISDDFSGLSQGQKQLLCIARVILVLPPILILDEATSNIDTRTEIKIQKTFAKLMKGRTSFIVAHRLSTIKNADIILVMKDGKIIEQGNHNELMNSHGYYEYLWNARAKIQ